MPQNCKISQRRLLLDQKRAQGFRSMSSTESRPRRPLIPVSPKKRTPCHWNRWSAWPGTGGRHPSESPVDMARIMHLNDEPQVTTTSIRTRILKERLQLATRFVVPTCVGVDRRTAIPTKSIRGCPRTRRGGPPPRERGGHADLGRCGLTRTARKHSRRSRV